MPPDPPQRPIQLPPELVALISQVELSQSEWWRTALGQAAMSSLWLASTPLSPQRLRQQLRDDHGVAVSADELDDVIGRLESQGSVILQPDGTYKISESSAATLASDIGKGEQGDAAAKEQFARLCEAHLPGEDVDRAWRAFNEELLVPLINELGANTYAFLQGEPLQIDQSPHLDKFRSNFPNAEPLSTQALAAAFLDPSVAESRTFVVNHLCTYFFVQATTWPRETIDRLLDHSQDKPVFRVFVDTNLLFSMLNLHENPANEAAAALDALGRELDGVLEFRLYLTGETIHEALHSLASAEASLHGVVLTPAVLAGTSSTTFSGLSRRFIDQAAQPGGIRSATEYFNELSSNILTLARAHGIELFNEDLAPYNTRQDVVDDILEQSKIQNARRKQRGLPDKAYEQFRHDVVLWHLANDKRDAYVESPLAAKFWIVTVDYQFLAYDARKRAQLGLPLQICVHPTTLVQMLSFWIPRGENLDTAIVRTLRMPLLYFNYDADLERATIKILQTLSRFSNNEKLSTGAITALVANKALRRRMLATNSDTERAQLIQEELIAQEESLRRELELERTRSADLANNARALETQVSRLSASVNESQDRERKAMRDSAQAAELVRIATAESQGSKDQAQSVKSELGLAETRAARAEAQAARLRVGVFVIASALIAAIPLALIGLGVRSALDERFGTLVVIATVLVWPVVVLVVALIIITKWGTAEERRLLPLLKKVTFGYTTLILIAFLVNLGTTLASNTTNPAPNPSQPSTGSSTSSD